MSAVPLLSGLLGDVQHAGDLLPRRPVRPGAGYGVRQSRVGSFADHAQELDEIQTRLVQGLADLSAVVGDHVALVEECFVGVRHESSLIDPEPPVKGR